MVKLLNKKQTKIPTQNNVMDVVKSQLDSIDGILDIVVKSSTSKAITSIKQNNTALKQYVETINLVFGLQGQR